MMKRALLISIFFFSTTVLAGAFTKMSTETGNFCLDQAIAHLRYLFGDNVEIKDNFFDQGSDVNSFWIKTNLCDGQFVAAVYRNASCTSAHYGFVPLYIRRLWAHDQCKMLLPEDTYPTEKTSGLLLI